MIDESCRRIPGTTLTPRPALPTGDRAVERAGGRSARRSPCRGRDERARLAISDNAIRPRRGGRSNAGAARWLTLPVSSAKTEVAPAGTGTAGSAAKARIARRRPPRPDGCRPCGQSPRSGRSSAGASPPPRRRPGRYRRLRLQPDDADHREHDGPGKVGSAFCEVGSRIGSRVARRRGQRRRAVGARHRRERGGGHRQHAGRRDLQGRPDRVPSQPAVYASGGSGPTSAATTRQPTPSRPISAARNRICWTDPLPIHAAGPAQRPMRACPCLRPVGRIRGRPASMIRPAGRSFVRLGPVAVELAHQLGEARIESFVEHGLVEGLEVAAEPLPARRVEGRAAAGRLARPGHVGIGCDHPSYIWHPARPGKSCRVLFLVDPARIRSSCAPRSGEQPPGKRDRPTQPRNRRRGSPRLPPHVG